MSLADLFVGVRDRPGDLDKMERRVKTSVSRASHEKITPQVNTRDINGKLRDAHGKFVAEGKRGGKAYSGGFSNSLKTAVGLGGLFVALRKGVEFLSTSNAAARESQKVTAITAQIIRSTGGAAKVTAGQVESLTTAIAAKSGVDDEAIQAGSNLLLTFKNVRNETGKGAQIFNRATQAAVDLSATGFGSITGSSKMLGKALNDPVKGISALSRAGVTFTDQQKEQIKTLVKSGDVLGAQKIIMKEVESQVGGTAAASATSAEKLKVVFGNFQELIGTILIPTIDRIADTIRIRVLPALTSFFKGIQDGTGPGGRFAAIMTTIGKAIMAVGRFLSENRVAVGAFVGVLATAAAVLKVVAIAQWALNVALTANPVGLVVVAIAALVGGLIYAYKHSETFRKVVDAVGHALKTGFLAAVHGVKVAVVAVGKFLGDFGRGFKTKIVDPIVGAWRFAVDSTVITWQAIKQAVKTAWDVLVRFLSTAVKVLVGPIVLAWYTAQKVTAAVFGAIANVIRKAIHVWATIVKVAITAVATIFTLGFMALRKVTQVAFDAIRKVVVGSMNVLARVFGPPLARVRAVFSAALGLVLKVAGVVLGKVQALFARFIRGVGVIWGGIKSKIIDPVRLGLTTALSVASSILAKIRAGFTSWKNKISDTWKLIKEKITTPIKAGIESARATAAAVLQRIRDSFTSWKNKVSDTWKGIKARIYDPIRQGVDDARARVGTVLGKIRDAFTTAKGNISRAWDGVKSKVSAPIIWVKDHVYNKPLVPVWNRVAGLVGGTKLKTYAAGGIADAERYANGGTPFGVRPGYTPGRDNQVIAVGGGEAIMRPEWTKIAGKAYVDAANAAARHGGVTGARAFVAARGLPGSASEPGGFAGGGVVGWLKNTFGSAAAAVKGLAGKIKGFALGGLKAAATAALSPLRRLIGQNLSGTGVKKTIGSVANKALDLVVAKIGKSDDAASAAAGGGGGDPGGPAMGGSRRRVSWKGGTFTERFRNTLIRAQRLAGRSLPVFQGGFSHRVAVSGSSHYGDAIDTQWSPALLSGLRRSRVAAWHRTPAQGFIHHIHGVPLPGAGWPGGSGVWQAQDYLRGGNGLMNGGLVKGGRGGVTARIGEGARDELVTPLPRGWNSTSKTDATAEAINRLVAAIETYGLQGDTITAVLRNDGSQAEWENKRLQKKQLGVLR